MTRRALFHFLASAAAMADPEKLLWTPGRKMISIPQPVVAPQPVVIKMMGLELFKPVFLYPDARSTHSVVYMREKVPRNATPMPVAGADRYFIYSSEFAQTIQNSGRKTRG